MKIALKIIGIILLILVVIGSGVTFYFYKKVKPIVLEQVNNALAVEVQFKDISISGLKDFPNLGIKLSGVKVAESTPYYRQKLLVATEISLFIDLLRMWKGEYTIDAITIRNGQINVADLKNGTNYDIMKPRSDTSSTNELRFEIKNLTLVNCNLNYSYVKDELRFSAFTSKTKVNIKYQNHIINLGVKSDIKKTYLTHYDEKYIANKGLIINTLLTIQGEQSLLRVAESDLEVEDIKLKTSGSFSYGKTQGIKLKFESNNTTAQSLLSILPESIQRKIAHIQLDGKVKLNGELKGTFSATKSPGFKLNYRLDKASISVDDQPISLSNISASGSVVMPSIASGDQSTATCNIKQANSGNNQISGRINIRNFDLPLIEWNGNAALDVPFLASFYQNRNVEIKQGSLSVSGQLKLQYNPEENTVIENTLFFSGNAKGQNIQGSILNPAINIQTIDFDISADTRKMAVNGLSFKYNNVSGNMSGYVSDYHSILSPSSDAELVGNLDITNLNVNDLLALQTKQASAESTSSDLSPVRLNLKSTIHNFTYNDFKAEQISGYLIASKNEISMPECSVQALEGNTIAAVSLKKWGEGFLLDINSKIDDINISKLFKQFNNFEQNEITDANINGRLSGAILAKLILQSNFELVLSKLYANADVTIKNGELKNYEPLKSLSKFVDIKDLENVQFKTLQNNIEIFDNTIFIPKMRIENNAINLELEGSHTFDNYMNYHISLSVAELLATKANWIAKKKERQLENNSNGRLTAYITMYGTPDNLKIAYDRATVKENVKKEIMNEKSALRRALKGEAKLEEESSETKSYDNVWDE